MAADAALQGLSRPVRRRRQSSALGRRERLRAGSPQLMYSAQTRPRLHPPCLTSRRWRAARKPPMWMSAATPARRASLLCPALPPPRRQLPAYSGEAALRGAFFNSLKEAAHICRGSAQRVMEMAAGAQVGLCARARQVPTTRAYGLTRTAAGGSWTGRGQSPLLVARSAAACNPWRRCHRMPHPRCLQEDLWRQVLAGSLQQYQHIAGPLQLAPAAVRGRGPAAVPVRLYIRRDAGGECAAVRRGSVELGKAAGATASLAATPT